MMGTRPILQRAAQQISGGLWVQLFITGRMELADDTVPKPRACAGCAAVVRLPGQPFEAGPGGACHGIGSAAWAGGDFQRR